jgi:hypothetical protein
VVIFCIRCIYSTNTGLFFNLLLRRKWRVTNLPFSLVRDSVGMPTYVKEHKWKDRSVCAKICMTRGSFALDACKASLGLAFICVGTKLSTTQIGLSIVFPGVCVGSHGCFNCDVTTESHLFVTISVSRRAAGHRLGFFTQCIYFLSLTPMAD